MEDSRLRQPAVSSRPLVRLRISNLSQHNSVRLPQILSISTTIRYCRDSDYSTQDRTSTLRKKPSPVVRVRRKRRKDADCNKGSQMIAISFGSLARFRSVVWLTSVR